ncbi:type II secretion system F family protein [Arenibaculum pallidiluteum]|uniref:type II secretion system F family protein n=1 Tax=Arenibaculum pallidiluteum TaxID=2812559 RepID=UPI001A96877C|nr:type II secretion system F family protein [Arenibaculum pallidiluteum]
MSPQALSLLVPTLTVFAGAFVAALCLAFAAREQGDRRFRRRLGRAAGTAAAARPEASIRIAQGGGRWGWADRLAQRLLPQPQALRARLARTGRRIPLGLYLLGCALAGAAAAGVAMAAGLRGVPVAVAAAIGALWLPKLVCDFMIARYAKRFLTLFPDAIDLIVRGLRSGLPVGEQLAVVGSEMADPVGLEFRRMAHAVKFGQTLEAALWETAERIAIPDFKFFVVSLAVQRETGGNLAETLGNLSDILRRRKQMRLKIKALASEATASALILGALPFLVFLLLLVLNYDYARMLFEDPRGQALAVAGMSLQAFGVFVMTRMIRFEI